MGRNAKLCKRIKKNATSSASHPSSASLNTANTHASMQAARKRADLKSKSKSKSSSSKGEHVLGGADYVTLLMGGRKKVAEEALKLPKD
ncbi:hypothetical protein K503DRAFT_711225 [Rhizopogon vinicolor AM-OR11-026]|uniref:Uncharacterized protein n=1 Tax=Rhizopogon vinicolor AM-OR11-026 TaxID=1314800 RepID=A0A1B7NB88_9AGAM|nr:hypothetical protein K503DRAFT_711225 [Rhizopogon vinicolor AM-OR11-026]